MKQFVRTVVLMVGLFLLSQLPSVVIGGVLVYNQVLDKEHFSLVQLAVLTFLYLLIGAVIVEIAQKRHLFKALPGEKTSFILLTIIIAYAIIMLGNGLSSWLLELQGEINTVNQSELNELMQMLPLPLFFIMAVVVAPVTEEIIFRGLAAKYFFPQKEWLGVVVGSLLFALVHRPTNLGSLIAYGFMSAALAFVYWRTKDLKYSIALHAFNNLVVFIAMLLFPMLPK